MLTVTLSVSRIRPSPSASAGSPLAGFKRDRRRHGSGIAADISADDQDGADFGDGAAERGQEGGQQECAAERKQQHHAAKARQPVDSHEIGIFRPQRRCRAVHQCNHDRRCKDHLGPRSWRSAWSSSAAKARGPGRERRRPSTIDPTGGKPRNMDWRSR